MLGKMLANWQHEREQQRRAAELMKNPVCQLGRAAIERYWTANKPWVKDFSAKFIDEQATAMMTSVLEVATAADPKAANREKLGGMTWETALYQVIVLSQPGLYTDHALMNAPGVTGELWPHLLTIAEKVEMVRDLAHALPKPVTAEAVADMCIFRYRFGWAFMSVHNDLRAPLKDRNPTPENDWFQPLFLCQCAWQEASIRQQCDLPWVLDGIEAIQYSHMMNMVMSDVQWPDLEWERRYGRPIPRMPELASSKQ